MTWDWYNNDIKKSVLRNKGISPDEDAEKVNIIRDTYTLLDEADRNDLTQKQIIQFQRIARLADDLSDALMELKRMNWIPFRN